MIIGLLSIVAPTTLRADEKKITANVAATVATDTDFEQRNLKPNKSPQNSSSTGQVNKSFSIPLLANPWVALATVLVLILGVFWLLKRISPGGKMLFGSLPVLQVLGRTHLSSKQTLVMIKVDNKLLLLGMTDHQITPLLTIDSPEEVSHLLTQIEQNRSASITTGFKHFFSNENNLLQQEPNTPTSVSELSSDKNAESGVLQLKTELNTLLQKVQKLKRNGGDDSSV
jgi:flagellar protein FliO/FliZ